MAPGDGSGARSRTSASGTPAQRDAVAGALVHLAAHELFHMQLVQTDPNFGNYLFDSATGRIALLDFYADWCAPCKQMERVTLADKRVKAKLASLILSNNSIGDAGAAQLAESLRVNATLTSLDLYLNGIGAAGASQLAESARQQHAHLFGPVSQRHRR
jgi:thiol-disulfide isomerase/thioredoxin